MDDIRKAADEFFRKNLLEKGQSELENKAKDLHGQGKHTEAIDHWFRAFQFRLLLGDYDIIKEKLSDLRSDFGKVFRPDQYPLLQFLEASVEYHLADYQQAKKLLFPLITDSELFDDNKALTGDEVHIKCEMLMLRGKIFWKTGDYIEAIHNYLQVTHQCFLHSREEDRAGSFGIMIGKALNLIGVVLNEMRAKENALEFLNVSLQWYDRQQDFAGDHLYYGILKSDIAYCSLRSPLDQDNIDAVIAQAKDLKNEADGVFEKIFGKKPNKHTASIYKVAARILREEKAGYLAICDMLERKIKIREQAYGTNVHATIARAYNHEARACIEDKEYEEGLEKVLNAINSCVKGYTSRSILENPDIENLQVVSNKELLRAFNNKAEILLRLYEKDPQLDYLRGAFLSLRSAMGLARKLRQDFLTEEAKLILVEQTRPVQELVMYLLDYIFGLDMDMEALGFQKSDLFDIILYNKAIILLENIVNPSLDRAAVSRGQSRNFKEFWSRCLDFFKKTDNWPLPPGGGGEEIEAFFEEAFAFLRKKQKKNSESLGKERKEEFGFGLDEFKSAILKDKELGILSFFMGEDALFGLYIDHNDFRVKRLNRSKDDMPGIKAQILEIKDLFVQDITRDRVDILFHHYPEERRESLPRLKEISFSLWKALLEPFDLKIMGIKKLCIIPDEDLWDVPFESLTYEKERQQQSEYHELPYLVNDFSINYHFSISLLHFLNLNGGGISKDNILLLLGDNDAPKAHQEAFNEMTSLKRTLETAGCARVDIREFHFFESVNDLLKAFREYNIVYISAHGEVKKEWGEMVPVINVSRNLQIRPSDIEAHGPLNPQLVIIDSCFSGGGGLRKGEGMMTLARALMLCQVPYIIHANLTNPIYTSPKMVADVLKKIYLEEPHLNVAEALTRVKREKSKNSDYKPNTWGSLVFIGDQTKAKLH